MTKNSVKSCRYYILSMVLFGVGIVLSYFVHLYVGILITGLNSIGIFFLIFAAYLAYHEKRAGRKRSSHRLTGTYSLTVTLLSTIMSPFLIFSYGNLPIAIIIYVLSIITTITVILGIATFKLEQGEGLF